MSDTFAQSSLCLDFQVAGYDEMKKKVADVDALAVSIFQ